MLLQHAPSHAHLSDMLIDGRPGVAKDEKRAFALATAGSALGCAHSKGVLGRCFVGGYGVAEDEARGLALGRESEAGGGDKWHSSSGRPTTRDQDIRMPDKYFANGLRLHTMCIMK